MTFSEVYALLFNSDITWYSSLARILVSFLFGIALGLERRKRNQFLGMRTLIVITVSSSLLMILSIYMGTEIATINGDPSRIAAQVVSGIGFLGAGTIVLHGINIKGLTSSAIIWESAAIGLTVGAGLIIPAFFTVFIILLLMWILEKVEEKFFPFEVTKKLHLTFKNKKVDVEAIAKILKENKLRINNFDINNDLVNENINITYHIRMPQTYDIFTIIEQIKLIGILENFTIKD